MAERSGVVGDKSVVLPPVLPDLFEALDAAGRTYGLLGGYCPCCKLHWFPLTEHCSSCRGPLSRKRVGRMGVIYSYTVVRTKAPFGLPEPYAVGYVDLDETPLRVFCLLDPQDIEALAVGSSVQLQVQAMGGDAAGQPCLRPMFSLVGALTGKDPR